ncbi:methyltransferase [Mesorhizobium sp. YM1C-6-2]|uniref:methyltransferase n=1 Tax=Mesorhizobium sp. YM1C-6-2 TaxID=1827501 RepID=UPI000EF29266|nr:methyltransferase [Mesorhizobium sp. YM1C-6-2]RLP27143.1 methyltransferase domain-containing protein [Mesorhizobium sp. YM1C-6-2]
MVDSDRIDRLIAAVPHALALRAGLDLGIFTRLAGGAATADNLGAALEVDPDRLSRLLYALASIGLLDVEDGKFRNGAEAAAFLDATSPTYRGGDHALLRELWEADLKTADSLRQNRPAALHDFSEAGPEEAAAFSRMLAPGGVIFGRQLAEAIDLSAVGSVIDIGGGAGAILVGLRERWPHIAATLMELPTVAAVAPKILAEYGAGDVVVEEGDITVAPSAGRHDLAILKAVVQVLPPDQARSSILNAARSLKPGGEIAIAGSGVVDDDRLGPPEGVFLNLTFLNLYRHGESYTEAQYRQWMTEAGFRDISRSRLADGSTLFRGRLADRSW